jgi:tetratricopeptide (TPR) repeat protein
MPHPSNESHRASPRLSVAMVVRDAEDCLAATLDSVRNLADEIVVLDTGSQDSTLRMARQKATRVIEQRWTDDFSAARNALLKSVQGDWVLWLDAGETLSPETAEALRKFIDHEADDSRAYYLLIRTPAQGANIAGEQVARIRLHPNRAELAFAGRVRESLAGSLSEAGLQMQGLSLTIERGAREHDPAIKRRRAERNLALAQRQIEEEGKSARLLNCLGEAAQSLGNNEASMSCYREALSLSTPGSGDMLEAYYGVLTALEGDEASRDAQLQLCMKALETFPLDAQLLCAIGGYLQSKEQLDLASRAYQLAAEHGQLNLEIWHLDGLPEIAMSCYALALQLLGRDDEAATLLQQQLEQNPEAARLRRQLLELHVRRGERDEALAVVNNMPRHIANREALRSAVRGACLAATGNWLNGKTYLETAYKAGCREPLCLRWLTAAHLSAGSVDEAWTTLEAWQRIEPLSAEVRQLRREIEAKRSTGPAVRIDLPGTRGQKSEARGPERVVSG